MKLSPSCARARASARETPLLRIRARAARLVEPGHDLRPPGLLHAVDLDGVDVVAARRVERLRAGPSSTGGCPAGGARARRAAPERRPLRPRAGGAGGAGCAGLEPLRRGRPQKGGAANSPRWRITHGAASLPSSRRRLRRTGPGRSSRGRPPWDWPAPPSERHGDRRLASTASLLLRKIT